VNVDRYDPTGVEPYGADQHQQSNAESITAHGQAAGGIAPARALLRVSKECGSPEVPESRSNK
jgi:hypothetical protein